MLLFNQLHIAISKIDYCLDIEQIKRPQRRIRLCFWIMGKDGQKSQLETHCPSRTHGARCTVRRISIFISANIARRMYIDNETLKRLKEVQGLDSDTRAHVFATIDAFIKAARLKSIAAL